MTRSQRRMLKSIREESCCHRDWRPRVSSTDVRLTIVLAVVGISSPAMSQKPCASLAAARQRIEQGWNAYRSNDIGKAEEEFKRALALCPNEAGALTGAGYAAMRQGRVAAARTFFARAITLDSASYDAFAGAGMAAYRSGDVKAARESFELALKIVPGDSTAQDYLARLGGTTQNVVLAPRARPAVTTVAARNGKRVLRIPDAAG